MFDVLFFYENQGHFTQEPRAMTKRLWEPKKKCPKAVPTHLQNHVMWSRTLKYSAKSYVTKPSTKCYFCSYGSSHMIKENKSTVVNVQSVLISRFCVRPTPKRCFFLNIQSDHETWSMWYHVGTRVDFTSILHPHTHSVVLVEGKALNGERKT